jgi:ribosomal protein S18 acetylase RimI-like enzyme
VVDDLSIGDLHRIAWSGTRRHVEAVGENLSRAASGQTECLAVRSPDGTPVALGAIGYGEAAGVGTIFQLSTHEQLRGLGLGTLLISAAEGRIKRRGVSVARLGIEEDNPRARALYERLGYQVSGRRPASWEDERDDGTLFLYETVVTELDKPLE